MQGEGARLVNLVKDVGAGPDQNMIEDELAGPDGNMIEDEPAGPDGNVTEAGLGNLVQDMGAGPDQNMNEDELAGPDQNMIEDELARPDGNVIKDKPEEQDDRSKDDSNSYLLANPGLVEAPDDGTEVQRTSAARSVPCTTSGHNLPHSQNHTARPRAARKGWPVTQAAALAAAEAAATSRPTTKAPAPRMC